MPDDKTEALDAIISSINSAESDIFLAMYNFSYKKIAKELVKASKREVSVTVLFEDDKLIKDRTILDMLKNSGINVIKCRGCGASIDVTQNECEYCGVKTNYLQVD